MADLVLQSQNIISADIPQIHVDEGIAKNLDDIARSREQIAAQYQKKSENIFANKFETQTRETANNIFNESPNDPDLVKKKIDEYADGVFKDIPFDQRSDFRKAYVAITNPLITKAFDNKNRILTNELIVSTEQNRDQILIDIQRNSENILVPDPRLSEDERLIQQTESLEALEVDFQSLNTNLNRVGPDGNPLSSPKEKMRIISNAKEMMLSTASKSWLDQQPNKLKALREWSSGALSIPVFDGETIINVPVKYAFNPAVVNKVEKELIARARQELSISDKTEKHNERIKNRIADEVANSLYSDAYTGDLDVREVDDWRSRLKPKDFRSLKKLAISGITITDGQTYNKLSTDARAGIDVTDAAIAALEDGKISSKDVGTLINMNRKDQNGYPVPVAEGQKRLSGILANVYTRTPGQKQLLESQATQQYMDALADLKAESGRDPGRDDTIQIAERIANSYSNMPEDITTKMRPRYGPVGLLGRAKTRTTETVQKIREETVRFFFDKWGGDRVRAANDPAYEKQKKLIDEWEQIAINNEEKLAEQAAYEATRRR